MGHSHGQSHGGVPHQQRAATRRALTLVLILTSAFTIAEFVAGLLIGSLALLADAGHMLSDDAALALALFATWLAGRPSSPQRSFGFQRAEILAALANGVALVAISIWIFIEASRRFADPPEVPGGWLLAVAAGGLAVNLAGALILRPRQRQGLNAAAAFRHIVADAVASVGVIAGGVVIMVSGWRYADPLVSVAIGMLVLASSWSILRDSVRILLEAAPEGIDADEVGRTMAGLPGVVEVHDLHVWTITSGFPALAAHVLVPAGDDCHERRRELELLLRDRFAIEHTTLQVDHAAEPALLSIEPSKPSAAG